MTLVQAATLGAKPPTLYYTFFSAIEIATTALIIWYAGRWAIGARTLTSRARAGAAPVSESSLTTVAD